MINLDETLSKEYLADKIVSNGLDDRLIITPEVNRVLEEVKSFDFRNFLSYDFITKKKEQNNLSEKIIDPERISISEASQTIPKGLYPTTNSEVNPTFSPSSKLVNKTPSL